MDAKGQLIPGKRLSGVIVETDRGKVTSEKDGAFSLAIPNGKFALKKVDLNGYILSDYEQVKWYGGYDNNFVIRDYNGDDVPKKVARVVGDKSGIILICESSLPGVQLYIII